ncbi:MAG TPA: TIGR01777 family oxidoreductase [Pirellulales bacterium]|nr:TIGR01777 family oxidoreductase [Pirellulales bacterium]
MRAVVTGGSGFIGTRLLEQLAAAGWEPPVVLSRDPQRVAKSLGRFQAAVHRWEPVSGPPPAQAFDGVTAVFHLAGESVAAGRWTKTRKERIRDSRVTGTRNLVAGLERLAKRPAVLISGSAVGYYGSRGDERLAESSPPGHDFLAEVCVAWEEEARRAQALGMRVALGRTGVVLGDGGALKKMLLPFKLGLGGPLAGGRQWMPWIHVDDEAGLLLFAAQTASISGPFNAVAPHPVTNKALTRALAKQLHRPAFLPAPYFGLKLVLGEMASMLVASQRVVPQAAEKAGYKFRYPELDAALAAILNRSAAERRAT